MAKDLLSYDNIVEISRMSVEEYRTAYKEKKADDDAIQRIIDRYKIAVTEASSYQKTWASLVSDSEESYDAMYADSLDYLKNNAGVTEEQWDEAYNASVSDNYATGSSGMDFENITIPAGDDNISIDWSEMQTMKKTQLSDGKFVRYAPSDDFDENAEIGESRNICGGTITYLGKKSVTYNRGNEYEKDGIIGTWANKHAATVSGNNFITGDNRTNMVHYEGVLGSFDYDANEFNLGYWETEVNGNKISVPVLHYVNDGATVNGFNKTYDGFLDGEHITIPEGIKSMDYMFADTGIRTMPEIPDSVESAHCAFMDCKELYDGCKSAKNDSGIYAGKLTSKSNLKDTSWMFAGCDNMRNYFSSISKSTVDGRYMYAECKSLGWDGETINENGEMENSFVMPDLNNLRHADAFWLQNMFDGCDDAVIKKIAEYLNVNPEDLKNGKGLASEWTDSDGVHHNRYDKLIDGSYNAALEQDISMETERGKILQLIDKNGKGLTGVASDTAGLASMGAQITRSGTLSDDSVWAKFRQSDFEATFESGNEFGEILNRAIPAVGTYAISKSLLNKMTNGEHKGIATMGAVALAAVPQIVGVGNTLTPMLDWTANAVGKDNRVGRFLTGLSDKLKGNVTYQTAVSELNVDETFETVQDSAVNYAENQVARLMTATGENDTIVALEYDVSADMKKNGELLAKDANLLFIACEPEENLKSTVTDSVMQTSLSALQGKMDLAIQDAGSDSEKLESLRETYSGYYMTLLYNLDAYDNAAKQKLDSVYATDPELKAQATNGLEKVMRCAAHPLYAQMQELQEHWQNTYGEPFFTDKQLNDETQSTKTMPITGLGTFNEFDPAKNYADQSDTYVEKLQVYQEALTNALATAASQEEIDAAYASYYETAYGWALDEAEAHGVILDKRGAQTTSEKNSFVTQLALLEAAKTTKLAQDGASSEDTTQSSGEITETTTETVTEEAETSEDTSSSTETHAAGTATESAPLPETVTVYEDGVMFDETYYAAANPDVVQAVGTEKNDLYTHFIAYGMAEGRPGYEGDAGQTLPAEYTEEILAEYRESMVRLTQEHADEQAAIAEKRAAQADAEGLSGETEEAEKTDASDAIAFI